MNSGLPLAIEIEINSDCNLSCAYCPNSKAERVEKGHMAIEVFETLMRQLQKQKYSGRISYHFYNEPTLSPNLKRFIAMTKEYLPDAKSVIYSNGTNLDKAAIDDYYKVGLDRFNVTEHHQTQLSNLDFLKEDDGTYTLEKFKFATYKTLPLSNRGGAVKAGPRISEPLKMPCFIPRCVLVVTVKGNVVACYEDYFQKHVMGNIMDRDIVEIWNSEKYVNFREELGKGNREKFEVCKTCNNRMVIV